MSKSSATFFLSVIFAAILLFLKVEDSRLIYALFGFALVCLFAGFWIFKHQLSHILDLTFLFYLLVWIVASFGVMALAPGPFWRAFFAFALAFGFGRLYRELTPSAHSQTLDNLFFFSVFANYLWVWAANFYFSPAWWLIISVIFLFSLVVFWIGLWSADSGPGLKFLSSLILALMLMQTAWAMLFWPVHFLPSAIVTSVMFYCLWMLARYNLQRHLTREKIIFYSVFGALTVTVTLLATAWLPKA